MSTTFLPSVPHFSYTTPSNAAALQATNKQNVCSTQNKITISTFVGLPFIVTYRIKINDKNRNLRDAIYGHNRDQEEVDIDSILIVNNRTKYNSVGH